MHQTISLYDFRNAFRDLRPNNFSYEGLRVLFDYLEAYEDETGEDLEFDVIAFCVDYNEMSLEEINSCYQESFEHLDHAADWLAEQTIVCGQTEDSVVFASF